MTFLAQNDIPCHHKRSLSLVILNSHSSVTIDGAEGGVKDLEYHIGSHRERISRADGAYLAKDRETSFRTSNLQNLKRQPDLVYITLFIFYRQYEAQEVQSGFPCPYLRLSTRR